VTWGWPFRRGNRPDRDVPWIEPALGDSEGLVGVGGELAPDLLLQAYSEGVFPWFSEGDPVLWWSPDPRAVIELDGLHVSRRLARTIRSGKFLVTVNWCFERVIRSCGEVRPEGTWITEEMIRAYTELHRAGYAHSVEVWVASAVPPPPLDAGMRFNSWDETKAAFTPEAVTRIKLHGRELAGGIYGVAIGGLFAGESMFHTVTDASKVALAALVGRLKTRGYVLFDVQMTTGHTERMGAIEIPRADYLRRLNDAVAMGVRFADSTR
jgi:leucyl/phenylalanyl-tRNA--protein transferase